MEILHITYVHVIMIMLSREGVKHALNSREQVPVVSVGHMMGMDEEIH